MEAGGKGKHLVLRVAAEFVFHVLQLRFDGAGREF